LKHIAIYATRNGKEPFEDWMAATRDRLVRAMIRARLDRVEEGNFGDHKSVGDGVHELRFKIGPGYRVYYALDGNVMVLLLCAGDKSSQDKDIRKAKLFWLDYQERK
jgi:putative addiction module killer protein